MKHPVLTGWIVRKALVGDYSIATTTQNNRRISMCRPGKANPNYKNGWSRHAVRRAWYDMKRRCLNPDVQNYKYYGGRGITVCSRWLTLENFWADMRSSWRKGLSLDRINNDGNYTPTNCRWATHSQQIKNQRRGARK